MAMIDIGTIRGYEIVENKDGDDKVLMLQVEFSNADDLQEVEMFRGHGADFNPQPGSRIIVVDLSPSYRIGIAVDDGVEPVYSSPVQAEGFSEMYSMDAAQVKKAWILLGADGSISISDGTGTIAMDGSGAVDINGHLTVAP